METKDEFRLQKQLRTIQICHKVLALLAIVTILVLLYSSLHAKNNDVVMEMFLSALGIEFILTLISVTLVILVRELKHGPNVDDKILLALLCFLTIFLTLFMPPVMILGLPLAILGIGVYNIYIAERNIRDLKITTNETELSA